MAAFYFFLATFCLSATLSSAAIPPPCKRLECPNYKLVDSGDEYEIRQYSNIVLASTSPIEDEGITKATRTGVRQLFAYILGKNDKSEKIEMAAPVVTQVASTNGTSSIIVSFYIPKRNQADPPKAKAVQFQRIKSVYAAVRTFPGFVSDSNVKDEVAALIKSVSGTRYEDAINKTHGGDPTTNFFVGQYNAPFELVKRTNEIRLTFSI